MTQIPASLLAEKFGGKHTLGLGILATSILNALSPLAIWQGGLSAFIGIRFLMGLFCGVLYPATCTLLSNWIPPEDKSKAGSFIYGGSALGTVFGSSATGAILSHYDWPTVFYFFSACGVAWYGLFALFCYNSPSEHPFISDEEANYLHERLIQYKHKKPPPTPWRHIMTSKPVWALIVVMVGNAWGIVQTI